MPRNLKTITVAELRDLLDGLDDNTPVVFTSDYGDHCHTEQVHPLKGEVEEVEIDEGAYSTSGWIVVDENEYEGDEDKPETVTVVRVK